MKNWTTLDADVVRIMNKHYTSGRSGRKVDKVVVHHNAGILTVDQIHDVWQTRAASAHYQVQTDGLIGQLVWDNDTAWHAGDWDANTTCIGIEHADDSTNPWHISQKTLEEGAHLVAAICHYYNLGRPQWGVNVFPHSQFSATSCPATLNGSQKDEYMSRAQYWYDQMIGGDPTPTPDPGYVDLDALADKTIRGDYGNGDARKAALGDYYDAVLRSQPTPPRHPRSHRPAAPRHARRPSNRRPMGQRRPTPPTPRSRRLRLPDHPNPSQPKTRPKHHHQRRPRRARRRRHPR